MSICSDSATAGGAVDVLAGTELAAAVLWLGPVDETETQAEVGECFSSPRHRSVGFQDYWHLE